MPLRLMKDGRALLLQAGGGELGCANTGISANAG
jgi:hypothetical protein